MEDYEIVDLYWARSEDAINATKRKYEVMLMGISKSLVPTYQDAEECVNDTYLAAWNSMPEERPIYLGAFLSKIVRRLSISKLRSSNAKKRGGADTIIEELTDCIPSSFNVESEYQNKLLAEAINKFLESLNEEKRYVFVRRYFFSNSVSVIASHLKISEGKVKTVLFRTRIALKKFLEEEGFEI